MEQYGEFTGVESLYAAEILQDDDSGYVADTPEYLAPVAEVGGTPAVNRSPQYYDNQPKVTYISEGPTEIKVVIQGLPAEKVAKYTGKHYDAASGRVFDTGEPNPPDFALGFKLNKGKSGYRNYWYLKGNFSGGAEEAVTKKDNIEVKTYELTYTAVSTSHKFTVGSESKSLKRVFGDDVDTAFDGTGWFTQVQTPDVIGAPDALSLTSSPLHEAIDVAVDAEPQLTFSNAIDVESIVLMNADTGALVTVTKVWNSAKKVLTLAHADFAVDTTYQIIVAGVTDTYGQALAAAVIEFSTVVA